MNVKSNIGTVLRDLKVKKSKYHNMILIIFSYSFKAYFKHRISTVSNWIQLNPVLIESVIQTPNLFATNQIDSSEHTVLLSAEFRKLWRFPHLLTTKWRTGGIWGFCQSIWHKLWVSTNQECEGWSDKKWWFFFFLLRVLYMIKSKSTTI